MKATIKIFLVGLIMGSLNLKAEGISGKEQRQLFVLNCGTLSQVEQEFPVIKTMTQEATAELIEARSSFYDVLKNGNDGLQRILKHGSSADTGVFEALVVCGALDSIKEQIQKQGCFMLPVFDVVKDGPGIKACEQFLARIPQ